MMTPFRTARTRRRAHDMSAVEPMRVFHCPMCGSGSVTARSDGTIECGYCTTVFTVNVQPNTPGMPQTVGDQPFQPGDPAEMAQETLMDAELAPEDGEEAPEQTPFADDAEEDGEVVPDDEDLQVLSLRRARRMGLRLRRIG